MEDWVARQQYRIISQDRQDNGEKVPVSRIGCDAVSFSCKKDEGGYCKVMNVIEKINHGVTEDMELHRVLRDPLYYPDACVVNIVNLSLPLRSQDKTETSGST